MSSASVSLFTASVLGLIAISYGAPLDIVQSSQNLAASAQSSSYNQESLNVVDNLTGPDYLSYDSASGSSSSQSLDYESNNNYLSTPDGLYSTGNSLYQQQQQQIEQEYSATQQLATDYSNLGSSYISQQQQQSEYAYNQQQSSLNQVLSI